MSKIDKHVFDKLKEDIEVVASTNPKDLVGAMKPDLSLLPASALIETSLALMYGKIKYDTSYNWRDKNKKVGIMTYLAASMRHLECFLDGENVSSDGLVSHLAHSIACNMIILDALSLDTAIDDRPQEGKASKLIEEASMRLKMELMPAWKEEKAKITGKTKT